MIESFERTESDLSAALNSRGLRIEPNAMTPLRAIDFSQLVSIHDHEERFLRDTFVSSLMDAHRARVGSGQGAISGSDVQTAMLMLGAAAAAAADANEGVFSKESVSIIRDICPYCS